jgi:hypothetical protein
MEVLIADAAGVRTELELNENPVRRKPNLGSRNRWPQSAATDFNPKIVMARAPNLPYFEPFGEIGRFACLLFEQWL